MKNLFLSFLGVLLSTIVFSQTGTIRGTVYDNDSGETVPFATIFVQETSGGTTTDLDGFYELKLATGTYTIVYSYLGYSDYTVNEINVVENDVQILDIKMSEEGQMLNEIVVTAKQARTTEAALATIKRRSTNMLDGISSQTFDKIGDSNAGEALKRVTGVSVEGGKHVYVRGLGDRYTKTILNGMDIPGLDPDRNSFEMDLLPTNLIDNIIVYKSFTPNLPGDFTGGVVDVITKDFPEEKYTSLSAGIGYNPDMHFNSNYIYQERSSTDLLGMDNGLRERPLDPRQNIPNPVLGESLTEQTTRTFQDNAGVLTGRNNLNKSLSFAMGNQFSKNDSKYSYIFSLNYKNNSTYYDDAEFNTYIYDEQNYPGEFRLAEDRTIRGQLGSENTLWSALAGGAYKTKNHRISFQAMRLQNGTSQAARQIDSKSQSSSAILHREVLEYSQREVTNLNITGKHFLNEGKMEIDWKVSPTLINIQDPDIRFAAFEDRDGDLIIAPAVGADITRTWRQLDETNLSSKIDFTYNLSKNNKMKAGLLGTTKNRDFAIQNYVFRVINQSELGLDGQAANIFNEENIWTPETNTGVYAKGNFEPANNFQASQTLFAAYIMNELEISSKLKAIYGLRAEKVDNLYTGQNNPGTLVLNNAKVLDELNLLPSINLVFATNDNTNLRASYNKTVARPTFKENSIAQIQDRITGRTFIGNINLKQTDIDNFDLRYETFGQGGQTLAFSGFFKYFKNPIELESFSDFAPSNFQPKNIAESASVYGVEVEAMKRLGFIAGALNNFTVGTNVTLVKSEVDRSNADVLPEGNKTRPMVGQSPYIINSTLGYNDIDHGLEINAGYNVQGKRLYIAGFGSSADVYDQPYHSLTLKGSKKFGFENKFKISVSADNLLNDDRLKSYEAISGETAVFERLRPGRTVSVSFSANL